MNKSRCIPVLGVVVALVPALPSSAISITSGTSVLEINETNGAIGAATFDGVNFFNEGFPVSNFGFSDGDDAFVIATTQGFGNLAVLTEATVAGSTVSGSFFDIAFARTYSTVTGVDNAFRVTTIFQNNGVTEQEILAFDTFDPDQGVSNVGSFDTSNDVLPLAGGTVGQATSTDGLTFLLGSLDSRAIVASGAPFEIETIGDLTGFVISPFDAGGVSADQGTHLGLDLLLGAGEQTTFTFDFTFGSTIDEAQASFIAANPGGPAVVPSPAAIGIGLIGTTLLGSRRRRQVSA